jgi:hypothetical protein
MTGRSLQATAALAALAAALGAPAGSHAAPAALPGEATALAPYFAPATAGPKRPAPDGFLQRWLLLEPIVKPNTSNTGFTAAYVRGALTGAAYPGLFAAPPQAGQVVDGGLRWRALDARDFDVKLFNLAQALGRPTYGVIFWAATVIDSPREMKGVRLAVGSNSASIWWVGGRETVDLFGDRRMVQDDVVSAPFDLPRGRTVIRGAVINGPGLSDFCVRLLDAQGAPVTDITTEVK